MTTLTLALAGDTMLGRGVAERLAGRPRLDTLFSAEVRRIFEQADLAVLNLECCVSARGERRLDPGKPFFFRAPPVAAGLLAQLGVDCVTLANNHALDFGFDALADTRTLVEREGVRMVGAGANMDLAREYAVIRADGVRLAVIGVTDHPSAWAAGAQRPGVAWANLGGGIPDWLAELVAQARRNADAVLVTPHWGPNLTPRAPGYVRAAARRLLAAGATVVAGHSAHVFHAAADRVVYDMGDFIDDYVVDPWLRNDLGLLFLVTLEGGGPAAPLQPIRLTAVPITIDHSYTRLADDREWDWISTRFAESCEEVGTAVTVRDRRLVVEWA
jgi:poly-gamma-glutamate synthesis protein (capsule biosynthesis protein)